MLRCLTADLHVHTCLSPCGDLTMSPKRIAAEAKRRGLDVVGICDHNSAENARAACKAAARRGISVLPGMEITTAEEVHLLALFDDLEPLLVLQAMVYRSLPGARIDAQRPREQLIVNERDEVTGYCTRLLMGATRRGLEAWSTAVRRLGGLSIASHIDRPSYSLISQLGFVPDGLALDAVELSPNTTRRRALKAFPSVRGRPMITASDAHYPGDVGTSVTRFLVARATVNELKLALENRRGRKAMIESQA